LERVLNERNFKYDKLEENQIILSRNYLFSLDENLTKQKYFSLIKEFYYFFKNIYDSIILKILNNNKNFTNAEIIVINCIKKFGAETINTYKFTFSYGFIYNLVNTEILDQFPP